MLKELCKNCLGYMRLEDKDFTGDENCRYADTYLVKAEKGKFEFKKVKGEKDGKMSSLPEQR